MRPVPAVAVEQPVDDVLRMRILEEFRRDGSELLIRCSLSMITNDPVRVLTDMGLLGRLDDSPRGRHRAFAIEVQSTPHLVFELFGEVPGLEPFEDALHHSRELLRRHRTMFQPARDHRPRAIVPVAPRLLEKELHAGVDGFRAVEEQPVRHFPKVWFIPQVHNLRQSLIMLFACLI